MKYFSEKIQNWKEAVGWVLIWIFFYFAVRNWSKYLEASEKSHKEWELNRKTYDPELLESMK